MPKDFVGKIIGMASMQGYSVCFEVLVNKSLGRKDTYLFYTENKPNNYARFFNIGEQVKIKATKQDQHKSYDILEMVHI